MSKKFKPARVVCAALAVVALGVLGAAPSASAHSGEYAKFNNCPSTNPAVAKCLYSKVTGGEFVLGSKKVPIVNPVVLQGGYGKANAETGVSAFFAPTSGEALSKSPQPVPGGLTGLVNCKEISLAWLRVSCEGIFENGLTGVTSTLELARPATEIQISERAQLFEIGTALRLPVKVHLENPLLGSTCYVGSSSSPIILNLTTGTTAPPLPNKPISGAAGTIEFKGADEGIFQLTNGKLVDNAWSAPGASGCGGFLVEYILDPIINASVGVPSVAGKNTAIQIATTDSSPSEVVNEN
ncbi:MAG TPA: hypothetical protein VGC32_05940 [Solirubrobacterales bacterium]